ncbi:MAG: hypothetical protein IPL54_17795 [Chitinophagaceae bacterium]|nr:hypothetical protein [Chitinophagaceae bacterium]
MKFYTPIFLLLFAVQACKSRPDIEAEKKIILDIHDQQRKAHLEKNPKLFLGNSSVDYIEVNRGVVRKPSYTESLKKFESYFNSVDFIKWDDVSPTIISFSDDATMATVVVDKLVVVRNKVEGNKLDTTQYAWLAIFKKMNGKWQLHRMGSTNK